MSQLEVTTVTMKMKTTVSSVPQDIQAKIMQIFANSISQSTRNVINQIIKSGHWPYIYKLEAVTPIPKVHPTLDIDD